MTEQTPIGERWNISDMIFFDDEEEKEEEQESKIKETNN